MQKIIKMNDYNELKIKLEIIKEELQDRLNRVRDSKRKPHDKDWSEQATERENDDVVDALGESIINELEQVNNALSRIDKNEYSKCVSCGEEISEERLFALPYTSVCINCAS
ncbi:MAG: TraR/DksA family transcriptional regulator [Thermodesulfobacteriota bacterium]